MNPEDAPPVENTKSPYEMYGESISRLKERGQDVTISDIEHYLNGRSAVASLESEMSSEGEDEWTKKYWKEEVAQTTTALHEVQSGANAATAVSVLKAEIALEVASISYTTRKIEEVRQGTQQVFGRANRTREQELSRLAGEIESTRRFMSGLQKGVDLLSPSKLDEVVESQSESLDITKLDQASQDAAVNELAKSHKVRSVGLKNGYYYFGYQGLYFEKPKGMTLLERVSSDPSLVLSPEDEQAVFDYERNQYKVHVSVPEEKRLAVCEAIMKAHEVDDAIVRTIFDEKERRKKAGEDIQISASREEMVARGAKSASIIDWKMKYFGPNSHNSRNADFVVYVHPNVNQSREDAVSDVVSELDQILSPMELPAVDGTDMPRYSVQAAKDGRIVPGVSIAQGNGDFKDYLVRVGGDSKLSQFYDGDRNYALRKETQLKS